MFRLAPCLLLLACPGAGSLEPPSPQSGDGGVGSASFAHPAQVLTVVDGDTIEVSYRGQDERLRLKGIDTPEMARNDRPAEPFAVDAKNHVAGRVGRELGLEFDPLCGSSPMDSPHCRDHYGRLLCYLRLADGSDLNEEIVRLGLARVYRVADERFNRQFRYEEAEAAARREGLGIWSR